MKTILKDNVSISEETLRVIFYNWFVKDLDKNGDMAKDYESSQEDMAMFDNIVSIVSPVLLKIDETLNKNHDTVEEKIKKYCLPDTKVLHKFGPCSLEILGGKNDVVIFNIWGDIVNYKRAFDSNKTYIASFTFSPLHGCCGVLVSANTYVQTEYRNIGIGRILQPLKEKLAHVFGYSVLLCTEEATNEGQTKVLSSCGWECKQEFKNRRTDHNVKIWTKSV